MLFISRSERDRISEVLAGLKDVSAVTVSEIPEFRPSRRGDQLLSSRKESAF